MTNNFSSWSEAEFEELKKFFYPQAYDIVENLQDLMLSLENAPEDGEALKAIKRHVHTLKGDSNTIGLTSIGSLCHSMEDMLSSLMAGSSDPGDLTHEFIDLLLSSVDTISRLLSESESGANVTDIKEIVGRIAVFLKKGAEHSGQTSPKPGDRDMEFTEYQDLQIQDAAKNGLNIYEVDIGFHPMCGDRGSAAFMFIQRVNALGHVIRSIPDINGSDIDKAERMTVLFSSDLDQEQIKKDAFITGITDEINIGTWSQGPQTHDEGQTMQDNHSSFGHQASSRESAELKTPTYKSEMLRVEASRVDRIMNLVGELIIGRSMIDQLSRDIGDGASTNDIAERLFTANSYMERIVSDLQKGVMQMRMVPINHVFRKFPKIVRDLSAEKGKRVRLDILGKETELDKGIVDALGEPLSHIFRNLIDHGIEGPAGRRSIGKPEEGVITLKAYHEAAQIVIEASDDGRGIDREKVKKKALERGFLAEGEVQELSDREAVNLIFLSGLSTSETVSETSGRGIGMDAVKTAVENMKGTVEVESTLGSGTTFILRLPLTLAVIKALLFEVGNMLYAIPISVVAEVARIPTDDLTTVDGRDTLLLRDRIISVIRLQELFRINSPITTLGSNDKKFVLILGLGRRNVGLLIDRLIGQQELVIKAVDDRYAQSGLVAGASILGNGRVVLILDAPAVFRKSIEDEKKRMVGA